MSREYDQLAWVDYPETLTPISAANLNRMENGIANLYTDRNKMENNIAYVEDGETATRHYFINSYLMLNGIFYKTTSEINIGDILDPSLAGNIEHVDISSQFGSGGGGSTGCVELTQAQYDALSDEAKMLDVIYLITDSPDNYLDEVFGDFATVEYTDTASKAYAVGDYLVYDSKFYKVTSAISQGDTITPDTNVVKTTVADEFSNASNVDYDNSASGWIATNVQSALDEMSNASLVYRGYFGTTVDLNDYESPGIYTFGTAVPTNAPLADAYGTLIAMRGYWPFQVLVYADNRIYTRTKTGNPALWGPWAQVPTTTTSTNLSYANSFKNYLSNSVTNVISLVRYGKIAILSGYFLVSSTDIPANTIMVDIGLTPVIPVFGSIVSQTGTASRFKWDGTNGGRIVNETVLTKSLWWNYEMIAIVN